MLEQILFIFSAYTEKVTVYLREIMTDIRPSVSIILPTYNENEILTKTVCSLCAQTYPSELMEIIVVDDCSSIPAQNFIPQNLSVSTKVVRHAVNKGRAAARNTGITTAVNEVLIFLDSDVIADPSLVASHAAQFVNNDHKTAHLGTIRWHPDVKLNLFTRYARWFEYDTVLDKPDLGFIDFAGANVSISRTVLRESGVLFDENFTAYGMEDIEFGYRLKKAGFAFAFCPSAIGLHYRQATLDEQIRRARQSAGSIRFFVEKHDDPEIVRQLHLLPPSLYSAHTATFDTAEALAGDHIKRLETDPSRLENNPLEREIYSISAVFLIESASQRALYASVPETLKRHSYTIPLQASIVDWAHRLLLVDRIYEGSLDIDQIYTEVIEPVRDPLFQQSLCHELGRYCILVKRYDQAQRILSLGVSLSDKPHKDYYLMVYLLGSIAKQMQNFEDAKRYFDRVINESRPYIHASQYASAMYHRGDIMLKEGLSSQEANDYFAGALRIYPGHEAAKSALRT